MSYFRPEIERMSGYEPGEQPQSGKFIKLNTNENPYPCSPRVIEAIRHTAEGGLRKYPDPLATAFRIRAGELYGVDPDGNEFELMWMLPRDEWGPYENAAPIDHLDLAGEVERWSGVPTAGQVVVEAAQRPV